MSSAVQHELLPRLARRRLFLVAAGQLALLLATANDYGYHRDELYFREAGRHLQWGYPDQPPLTPLVGRLSIALFGDTPRGIRVFAALAAVACALLAGLIARELGGGGTAQTIAAGTMAVSGLLLAGHLLSTATFDIFFWTLLGWLLVRLVRTGDPRLWPALGVVTGVALLNKHLVVLFWLAVVIGLAAGHRLELLRSRFVLVAAAIAAAMWTPNLVWQAQHGWPQLTLAHQIAREDPIGNRIGLIPFQLVLIGPLLSVVWIGGLLFLLRDRHAFRWIPFAYAGLVALMLVTAGKPYYPAGFYPLLVAAGAVWLECRRIRPRLLAAGAAVSLALSAAIGLPLVPVESLHATPVPAVNKDAQETVGWPALVREVAAVYRVHPQAAIFTTNYGEAGAIDRYGPGYGLPRAYSGHNGFADWGIPAESHRLAIVVGVRWRPYLDRAFTDCRVARRIENGVRLDNEEEGAPIWVCRVRTSWRDAWPRLRHLDA